jgi:hypothetical protein
LTSFNQSDIVYQVKAEAPASHLTDNRWLVRNDHHVCTIGLYEPVFDEDVGPLARIFFYIIGAPLRRISSLLGDILCGGGTLLAKTI